MAQARGTDAALVLIMKGPRRLHLMNDLAVDYDKLSDRAGAVSCACIKSVSISCGKCCGTSERVFSASPIAARTADRPVTFV
jgi:hypothetical protein